MSLQAHFSTPVHKDIEQIWSDEAKELDDRLTEISDFLKEKKIYCVWVRWPHWYSHYSSSEPVIHIPTKIVDIDYRSKISGRDVPCMKLEHEFLEADKGSPYILKAELHQCHFISEHSWSSVSLKPYRQSVQDIRNRFERLERSYRREWDVMRAVASELHKEQAIRHQAMATPPPSFSQSSSATTTSSVATPPTPTPIRSADTSKPTGTSMLTTPAASSSSTNRLKRSIEAAAGTSEDESCSSIKRPAINTRTQASRTAKEDEQQTIPEPPTQCPEATPNGQVEKLAKARNGITKASSHVSATESQAKALEEQVMLEVGESSVSYWQAKGLLLQLQRIKRDLTQVATEIE